MVKRANGLSTIEQLPSGSWRVRATVRGKRTTLGIFATLEEAETCAATFAEGRAKGALVGEVGQTLESWGRDWLDDREVNGSKVRATVQSIRVERSAWTTQVAPSELGRMRLGAIETAHIEAWTRWLRARTAVHAITKRVDGERIVTLRPTPRPLSRSSQLHALRLVRHALQAAVGRGVIDRNPADGVKIATGNRRARDLSDDWLRHEEIGTLLVSEAISLRLRTAYACAIGLALRLSDLKAVELSQVHLDAQVPGPHLAIWVEKSERYHRVPVLPWLEPILRAHVASLRPGTRYLFPTPDGGRYTKSYDFQWASKPGIRRGALERAGVGRRVRFHDLRGSTATHLALGTWGPRWSLHEIQQMLAHSSQKVTERYVRRAADMLAETARRTTGGVVHALSTQIADPPTSPARIERATFRLEGGCESESDRVVTPSHGQRVDDLATRLLEAGQGGAFDRGLLDAFVDAVEASEAATLLRQLRLEPGHPLELRRAMRLAELVGSVNAARAAGRA